MLPPSRTSKPRRFRRRANRAPMKRMDDGTELSLTIAQIVQRLKGSHLHSQIERQAKECLHQPEIKLESLKEDVRSFLKTSGWERKLQNAVYRELHVQLPPSHPSAPPEHLKEPLAYMRKAQRPAVEQKELTNKWNEMGTDEPDLSRFRPVYAPKDFLEVLIGLRNPNHDSSEDVSIKSHWGLIQVPLNVRDIPQLRRAYSELNLTSGQLGIDDHAHIHPDLFENEYVQIGKKVVVEQDSAAAQQYSRQGCPTGLRADLWALILNSTNQPQDVMHYEQLMAGVIQHDLLVDNLIYKDVKLTASNDDYYFVFEDFLYQVLLCFSRDTAVLEHFKYNSATPPRSYIQGKGGDEECAVVYPPNGVIPFHGFSMYVAPLCFLYNEPSKLYSVFREMYIRYFFRLHSISSSPSGIVSLCLQFERLLQTHLPQLFYHLRQIGAQPLRIAFKWMVRGFSGYLSTDQLLLLWDRILGYDSLEVVAVLAAAVFAFRAENLMEVTSLASAEAVLADLSTLKVIPLIQIFLFATAI
uniref:TBC1 domain family, member 19 n=1 Tax=Dicentrarchus labrax TaxID=13489 RepID=A0A8P4KLQ0_DICLA